MAQRGQWTTNFPNFAKFSILKTIGNQFWANSRNFCSKPNYYTALGVQRGATQEEIKAAYKEHAKNFTKTGDALSGLITPVPPIP